ncbi:hypothetical protein [Ancylobacter terrae]|uniref:hypothetical protein n=1 Tax=Ancylobacter sp. sgz301288 TaxID=3342077 RepID=UPI0038588B90
MNRAIIALAFGIFALSGAGAQAQTMSYAQAGALIAKSCGADIEKFCRGLNLGGGRIATCLTQNQAKISPQCISDYQAAVASVQKRVAAQAAAFQVCRRDAAEFCKGVKAGDANLLNCLLDSVKVVDATCSQTLTDAGWN